VRERAGVRARPPGGRGRRGIAELSVVQGLQSGALEGGRGLANGVDDIWACPRFYLGVVFSLAEGRLRWEGEA
jgi:hypothetical protein